jgi:hypothetical protein
MPASGRTIAASAAIVVTALALYWPATSAWFYQDDLQWLAGTLTFGPTDLLDFESQTHFFRPVISLYFWAATPLFAGSPAVFHWANHVLHAVNGLLVLLLARMIGFSPGFGFLAAVFFVSMPAYVEAIAWISALAEPVTTFFGIISLCAFLRARREASRSWKAASVIVFFFALITHESSVVLLPLLVIADWAFAAPATGEPIRRDILIRVRCFAPYAIPLVIYLAFDALVNQRSYLVEEGHYRIGWHAVENLLGYVVTLFVGERNLPTFIVVTIVLALLLLRGSPRAVFATAWILLSILPFSFFTWSTTSRYAYMPAVGMALLLAEGLAWLHQRLARGANHRVRVAVTGVLAVFIAIRFMLFAAENIENFSSRTEPYRRFAEEIRRAYPEPARGATLSVEAETADALQFRYIEALARWEFKDPSLALTVRP